MPWSQAGSAHSCVISHDVASQKECKWRPLFLNVFRAHLCCRQAAQPIDEEIRNSGIAILHEKVLPFAMTHLQSGACGDPELGFNILYGIRAVVAGERFLNLIDALRCNQPEYRDPQAIPHLPRHIGIHLSCRNALSRQSVAVVVDANFRSNASR